MVHRSLYFITADITSNELCKTKLTEADLHKLHEAIEDLYYFEFVIGGFEISLITEHLTQFMCLKRHTLNILISGMLGVCVLACVHAFVYV